MNRSVIYFILALGLFSFNTQAQVKFNQVSAGVSYWERSYEGLDERAFLLGYPGEGDFTKGSVMPFIAAEVGVWGDLAIDARVALWTGEFRNGARFQFGDDVVNEEISQTIIPVSLGAVYRWNNLFGYKLGAFLGAGVNRYFIQNKVERTVFEGEVSQISETFSGNNYGGYAKAGLEYMFTGNIGVGLDLRYNLGNYNQNFQTSQEDPIEKYEVSLKGIEAGLSFIYRFAPAADAAN